jgi:hypothetical protein
MRSAELPFSFLIRRNPMNSNIGVQTSGTVAWDGAAATPGDLRRFVQFGWSFEVTAPIVADAVFFFEAAEPSDANICAPGPWSAVEAIATCHGGINAGESATVTIPAGTPVGSVCAATLPCKPAAFVRLASAAGDTDSVVAVLLRQGPML